MGTPFFELSPVEPQSTALRANLEYDPRAFALLENAVRTARTVHDARLSGAAPWMRRRPMEISLPTAQAILVAAIATEE